MKKRLFTLSIGALLVCGSTIVFSSCSKDKSKEINGEWLCVATYWAYSGSPNASSNYSSGGPVTQLDGAGIKRFVFNEDKTGMILDSWFIRPGLSGIDTIAFTYTIDGDCGVITLTDEGGESIWTTTHTIQDITKNEMVVYKKSIAENYQDNFGDTTPYTRTIEHWNYCEKR